MSRYFRHMSEFWEVQSLWTCGHDQNSNLRPIPTKCDPLRCSRRMYFDDLWYLNSFKSDVQCCDIQYIYIHTYYISSSKIKIELRYWNPMLCHQPKDSVEATASAPSALGRVQLPMADLPPEAKQFGKWLVFNPSLYLLKSIGIIETSNGKKGGVKMWIKTFLRFYADPQNDRSCFSKARI